MSVSGAWSGVYHYPGGWGTTPFLLTLNEAGSMVSGMIEEPDTLGMFGGRVAYATFSGQREGSSLVFEKTYEDLSEGLPTITYVGVINADETKIEGEWILPGELSGAFKMDRRASGVGDAVKRTVTVDR